MTTKKFENCKKNFRKDLIRCITICCFFLVVAILMTNLSGITIKYTVLSQKCSNAESNGEHGYYTKDGYITWTNAEIEAYNSAIAEKKEWINSNPVAKFFEKEFSDNFFSKALRYVCFFIIRVITYCCWYLFFLVVKATIRRFAVSYSKLIKMEKKILTLQ